MNSYTAPRRFGASLLASVAAMAITSSAAAQTTKPDITEMSNTEIAIVLINASNGAKNPTEQSARKHIIDNGCEEIIPVIEFYMDIDKARTDKQTPILKDPKIIELVRGKRNDGQWSAIAINILFYFRRTIDADFKMSHGSASGQNTSPFQIAAYALADSISYSGNSFKGDVLKEIGSDAKNWGANGLDRKNLESLYRAATTQNFKSFLTSFFPDEIATIIQNRGSKLSM